MSTKADLARNVDQTNRRASLVLFRAHFLRRRATYDLLAIQLDDQLLIHWQLNIFPLRQRGYSALKVLAINFDPVWRIRVPGEFFRLLQNRQLLAGLANGDLFSDRDLVRRNIHLPAIDADVSMTNKLPRLSP